MSRNSNQCRRVVFPESEFPELIGDKDETSFETPEKRKSELDCDSELKSGARRRLTISEAAKSVSPELIGDGEVTTRPTKKEDETSSETPEKIKSELDCDSELRSGARRKLMISEVAKSVSPEQIGDGEVTTRPTTKEDEANLETPEKRKSELDCDSELRSGGRRRLTISEAEKSVSPALTVEEETDSCCSSDDGSVQLVAERSTIGNPTGTTESAQLETLTFSGGICNRNEAIPASSSESGDMESAVEARSLGEANSRFKPTVHEIPSKAEIDDFFSSAEKDLHKRFSEKYNFDVKNGVPMKGRYEWVPVKP